MKHNEIVALWRISGSQSKMRLGHSPFDKLNVYELVDKETREAAKNRLYCGRVLDSNLYLHIDRVLGQ